MEAYGVPRVFQQSSISYLLRHKHLERGLLRDKVRTARPASTSGQHLMACTAAL